MLAGTSGAVYVTGQANIWKINSTGINYQLATPAPYPFGLAWDTSGAVRDAARRVCRDARDLKVDALFLSLTHFALCDVSLFSLLLALSDVRHVALLCRGQPHQECRGAIGSLRADVCGHHQHGGGGRHRGRWWGWWWWWWWCSVIDGQRSSYGQLWRLMPQWYLMPIGRVRARGGVILRIAMQCRQR
jgi:hypothetical protein